jgi:hypothetical protein
MTGKVKSLLFSEGVSVSAPTDQGIETVIAKSYASDSAYQTDWGAPSGGELYYNTTSDKIRWYDGASSSWKDVGSGSGGGGVNLITNPNGSNPLDQTQTYDLNDWIDSATGQGTTSSITTTTTEIPLYPLFETAIKITFGTDSGGNDYTRVRWQMPEAMKNRKLELSWHQLVSSYTAESANVELYSYTASDFSTGETEVILGNADTSGDMFIGNFTGFQPNDFDATGADYYELRFINNGATTGYVSLNEVTVGTGDLGSGFAGWKQYDSSTVTFSSTPTGWSLTEALAIPYKTSNGSWRLRFNIQATHNVTSAGTTVTPVMDGVTFKTGILQALANVGETDSADRTFLNGGSGIMSAYSEVGTNQFYVSGDVALDSIPTWAEESSVGYIGNTNPTTIAASYTTNAAQSIGTASYTIVDFEDVVYDETPSNSSAVTTGASWKFTAPRKGKYLVNALMTFDSTAALDIGEVVVSRLVKNNTTVLTQGEWRTVTVSDANSHTYDTRINYVADLDAGDYIDARVYQSSGGNLTLIASSDYNNIQITELTAAPHAAMFKNATADRAGLLSVYEEYTDTGISSSDFTGGDLKVIRIGNHVTVTLENPTWSGTDTVVISSAGLLPERFRPSGNVFVTQGLNTTATVVRFDVLTTGQIRLGNQSATDLGASAGVANTSTIIYTMSYTLL